MEIDNNILLQIRLIDRNEDIELVSNSINTIELYLLLNFLFIGLLGFSIVNYRGK